MIRAFIAAAAAIVLSLSSGAAFAQELVTNGSFEPGTAGWTVSTNVPGGCAALARPSGATQMVVAPSGPTAGANYVELYPTAGSQICRLYQDVAIPPGASSAAFAIDASASFSGGATTLADYGRVDILTTSDVLLQNIFLRDGTQANLPNLAHYTANLTPYAGQTVRIAIIFANGPVCCNETFADAVSILAVTSIPTLSQWAMILLAVLMAGTGVLILRRRHA